MFLTQGLNAPKTVTVSPGHNPSQKTTKPPPPPPATVRIREIKGKNPPFIHSKFDRAETHPNKNFINYLINGLEQGFHTSIQEVPTSTFDWNAKISANFSFSKLTT